MAETQYRRILVKLSGEALKGPLAFGVDPETAQEVAKQIRELVRLDIEVALVIGGGNIFRGLAGSRKGMDRATADYMGMLATVINALALQDALESIDVATRVQSAIEMRQIAEPYIRRRAMRHLEKGRVVIFSAGTGSPYFSTDTTAALRANEIGAEAIFKATKVDGVYTADPTIFSDAKRYETITYREALEKRLQVLDSTAFSMCMDNEMPIIVFNFRDSNSLINVVKGDMTNSTLITS